MIADLINGLFDVVAAVITGLGTSISAIIGLLYVEPTGFSLFGYLVLAVVGAPLAWQLMQFVISLFKQVKPKGAGAGKK